MYQQKSGNSSRIVHLPVGRQKSQDEKLPPLQVVALISGILIVMWFVIIGGVRWVWSLF